MLRFLLCFILGFSIAPPALAQAPDIQWEITNRFAPPFEAYEDPPDALFTTWKLHNAHESWEAGTPGVGSKAGTG